MRSDTVESPTPPLVACLFNAEPKAVAEETEGIEEGTFANTIFADYRRHRSQSCNTLSVPQSAQGYIPARLGNC